MTGLHSRRYIKVKIPEPEGAPMSDHQLTDSGCSASNDKLTISRRDVIKSVIATGVVSSTSYLFRVSKVWAQASAPGAVERLLAEPERLGKGRANVGLARTLFDYDVLAEKVAGVLDGLLGGRR